MSSSIPKCRAPAWIVVCAAMGFLTSKALMPQEEEELSTYDPAEDLTSTKAIEAFMAEAFKTKDAGFIAYADSIAARVRAKDTSADGIVAHAKDAMKHSVSS